MKTEDLEGGDLKDTKVEFKSDNDKDTDTDNGTVKHKILPVKEFAKLMKSPKKNTFVGKFEGFFQW